jgi:uncharacterized protein (TIGR04255 family)
VKNHKPWRNAPLQEAVFEIRFPSIADYALFAGGMAMSQKKDFPTTLKLHADIPEMIELAGFVKHRFISQDGSLLFQTGSDVLSINSISYNGFSTFLESIQKILIGSENFINISSFTRLGLRYINKFSNVEDPSTVLNINLPFNNMDVSKTQLLQIQEINKINDEGMLQAINIQFPAAPKDLILDLDVSLNLPQQSWDVNEILNWADKAHDIIWDKFQTLISDNEKEVRV